MVFNFRDGGPWGSGGNNGNSRGPWGGGGSNGSGRNGGGGNNTPPDLEEMIKGAQSQLKKMFPGSGSSFRGIILLALVAIGFWLSSGIFRVKEGEQGAVLRFGKWDRTISETGLHYHLPSPIESVIVRKVAEVNRIDIGTFSDNDKSGERQVSMLTGDENIIDVNMTIFWFIKDLNQYLFRSADPERTVKIAAESAVREVIAQTPMELALTKGKSDIVSEVRRKLQAMLDDYQIGIQIQKVDLQKVDAPGPVIDAFRDVQSARADEERMVNEATGYRDSIIPVARGEATKITKSAEAYKDQVVAKARGDSERFKSVYNQYKAAPDVTKKRMYIETMEKVMRSATKVFIDAKSHGVLPYLPLPELKNKQTKKGKGS